MWTLTGVASARGKGESRETISGHNRPNSIDATFQNSNWQPNKMRKPVEKKRFNISIWMDNWKWTKWPCLLSDVHVGYSLVEIADDFVVKIVLWWYIQLSTDNLINSVLIIIPYLDIGAFFKPWANILQRQVPVHHTCKKISHFYKVTVLKS